MKTAAFLAIWLTAVTAFGATGVQPPFQELDVIPESIPALVRSTLDERCATCHSEPSRDFGGLDLSHWTDTPDGTPGFVHLDAFKKQRPSQQTFRMLLDRLTTSDPDAHMPLGDTLEPANLQALTDWVSAQLH